MGHICEAIVFRCIDHRIDQEVLTRLLREAGVCSGKFDLVSVAGAAKDLLSAEGSSFLLKQVEISQLLHDIKKIVLVPHDDCGAYGTADSEEEEATQTKDLTAITQLLGVKFPELTVERLILKGTKTGEFSLKRV
jgi:carbonic anhydrase